MKRVFVLTIRDGFDQKKNLARGYIEDVATGREYKFQSPTELLQSLEEVVQQNRWDELYPQDALDEQA